MTTGELAQVITAVAACASVLASLRNAKKLDATAGQVNKIEVATNSMKDALVSATAKASHAEGLAEGKAQSEARS